MTPTFLQLVLLFLLYAFLGWCVEVIFAASNYGKFVNRGFLNGPVCPIYGMGVLSVALVLRPVADNLLLLFLGSVILTSAIEFFIGFVSEKILGVRLWDYRDNPFNLCGYICLKFSLLWGLACVFILKLVHPAIVTLVSKIPTVLAVVLASALSAIFVADVIITMIQALKLPKRIQALSDLEQRIRATSDWIGENLSENTLKAKGEKENREEKIRQELSALRAHYQKLLEQKNFVHNRLIAAFPALRQGEHSSIVEKIRLFRQEKKQ